MSHTSKSRPTLRLAVLGLVLPLTLAACGQSQQVEPQDLPKPQPTYSKLGTDPIGVE